MKNSFRRPSPALVIACLALVLALGGTAVAAKRYLITNTKQISPAAVKQIAKLAARQGAASATGGTGAAGKEGAPGPTGATGAAGPEGKEGPAGKEGLAGPPGPGGNMSWAVVEPHGAVERASETNVAGNEVATGTTLVTFGNLADVTECAYEATIGLAGQSATAFPGFATVVRSAAHENAVLVQTFNENGVAAELGFHLAVLC
jgi:hypothetical protein